VRTPTWRGRHNRGKEACWVQRRRPRPGLPVSGAPSLMRVASRQGRPSSPSCPASTVGPWISRPRGHPCPARRRRCPDRGGLVARSRPSPRSCVWSAVNRERAPWCSHRRRSRRRRAEMPPHRRWRNQSYRQGGSLPPCRRHHRLTPSNLAAARSMLSCDVSARIPSPRICFCGQRSVTKESCRREARPGGSRGGADAGCRSIRAGP
jgi:hypothetical protein